VFKLGTIYSDKLGATFPDEDGTVKPSLMGCYGIGVGRLLASVIEASHDENGIIMSREIAPYDVYLAGLNLEDDDVRGPAEKLYADLQAAGVEVLFDDRGDPPGVKFKDADLIGLPLRVVISRRSLKNGGLEVKARRDKDAVTVPVENAVAEITRMLESL
jgi:prolyl-tRNA synthetase